MTQAADPTDAHRPVLPAEVIDALAIDPAGVYIDGTFGRGGHSAAILDALGPAGRVYALDRDPEAVAAGLDMMRREGRLRITQGSFSELLACARRWGVAGQVNGVLLDLGVSSPQLDDASRGFSFMREGPLDMRMEPGRGVTAAQWLAEAPEEAIAQALFSYGEERHARRIARAIVEQREREPIVTTGQLAQLVARVSPSRERRRHPATRTFQAIRIVINEELDALSAALEQSLQVLRAGGRLVVISFHSLEDRLVKRFLREHSRVVAAPRRMPLRGTDVSPLLRVIGKLVRPSQEECRDNPRARSARMRVAERLA